MRNWGKKVLKKFAFFQPGRAAKNCYAHFGDDIVDLVKWRNLTASNYEGEYLVYYDQDN
jgi:hypothetical protein